jgi:SAM-dependent methyltransferase
MSGLLLRTLLAATVAVLTLSLPAQSQAWDDGVTPFVVTPDAVVDRMLHLAQPRAGERLIDLGSGDGRIVIQAAKRFGAVGHGVDIDPRLVKLAQDNARRAGVEKLATFEVRDLFETDLRGASVISMYLLPEVNRQLLPRLLDQLKPGARIVSHDYDLGPWPYDEMIDLPLAEKLVGPMGRSRIFLWIVPADVRGRWTWDMPQHGGRWQLDVKQEYQVLDAEARLPAGPLVVRGARMRGEEFRMAVTGVIGGKGFNQLFRGTVKGDTIEGEVRVSDGEAGRIIPWKATRQP